MCPPKRVTGNNLVLHKALGCHATFGLVSSAIEMLQSAGSSQPDSLRRYWRDLRLLMHLSQTLVGAVWDYT